MKAKFFAALLLAAVMTTGVVPCATAADAPPASRKSIKDAAEYNAYIAALNTADPVQRAAAFEAFVVKYPDSVVKTDALEQATVAYQQSGNIAKTENAARRLLVLDPDNLRALTIVTFVERVAATAGSATALTALKGHAERGMRDLTQWPKPDGTSDADFAKQRAQMEAVFEGALGYALLNAKDYAGARDAYLRTYAIDPSDMSNTYQLGLADAQMAPLDPNGFWYLARAMALAKAQKNVAAHDAIETFAKAAYLRYHGTTDGWVAIVAAAAAPAAPPAPPSGFAASVKARPTPPEIAVIAVNGNDPSTMSFSDWEFVLGFRDYSLANKAAADKVWAAIQAKEQSGAAKLKLSVFVIASTRDTIDAAITDENVASRKADLHVIMAAPLPKPPAPGTTINVIGVISSYTPVPFMFTMTQGRL